MESNKPEIGGRSMDEKAMLDDAIEAKPEARQLDEFKETVPY